jgi:hypothetical protein
VVARLTAAFGLPREIPAGEGMLFYRWLLRRADGDSIYLTVDSPERTDIAHVLVSDPRQEIDPVASLTIRTMPEVEATIEKITAQWKGGA